SLGRDVTMIGRFKRREHRLAAADELMQAKGEGSEPVLAADVIARQQVATDYVRAELLRETGELREILGRALPSLEGTRHLPDQSFGVPLLVDPEGGFDPRTERVLLHELERLRVVRIRARVRLDARSQVRVEI